MSDTEVHNALNEVRDAVDRLSLIVFAAVLCRKDVSKVVKSVTPLLNEIAINRRFSSDKHVRAHEVASASEFNPNNPYKPEDYDKD